MAERVDPIDVETKRWLMTLRELSVPEHSHTARAPSPAEVLRLLDLIDELANRCRQSERFLVDARTLPTDEFIALALDRRLYRVDLDTGYVYSCLSGARLGRSKTNGYLEAVFTVDRVGRSVLLHRVVAIACWGVDAVRGQQVAHLNHDKQDNRIANLKVMTVGAHYVYDRDQGRRRQVPLPALPCVLCGQTGGYLKRGPRPARSDGTHVGMPGPLCSCCYHRLWKRARKEREEKQHDA
jgi:hypothetical protein